MAGKRVLVVDTDPQANATSGLGINPETVGLSMYDVFMSEFEGFPDTAIQDIVMHTRSGIDIAPSTLDLVGVEPFLYNIEYRSVILRDILTPHKNEYDFIMIDTPPSMGQFVINGLVAADHTVVTFDRGIFALNGLNTLMTIFDDIRELVGEKISPDMAILTRWDPIPGKERKSGILSFLSGLRSAKTKTDSEADEEAALKTFESEVRKYFSAVYTIPFSRAIYESQQAGLPISHFAPDNNAAKVYREIADEIMKW
jgi:chromosome partitioning protein